MVGEAAVLESGSNVINQSPLELWPCYKCVLVALTDANYRQPLLQMQ